MQIKIKNAIDIIQSIQFIIHLIAISQNNRFGNLINATK